MWFWLDYVGRQWYCESKVEIKYHGSELERGRERYQIKFPSFSKGNVILIVAVVGARESRIKWIFTLLSWSFHNISKKNSREIYYPVYIWYLIGGQNSGLNSAWWKPHKWCLPGQCCEVLWGKFKGQYLQSVESLFVKLLMAKLFPFIAHSPPFCTIIYPTLLIWKCFNCTFFSNHPVFISVCNIGPNCSSIHGVLICQITFLTG